MNRTTTLLASALLSTALLPSTAAAAVGETCQGQPATVVGTSDQALDGTDGADVIVTNGASRVNALGGDDLVCVTGAPATAPDESRTVAVLAGAGNDRVEATTPGWGTLTALGTGADSYLGTSGADQEIRTDDIWPTTDVEADTVRVTAGNATVYSGAHGHTNSDVVEINVGVVQWTGFMTPVGSLTGGPFSTLRTYARSGDAMINAARGTAATETSSATFSGFGELEFATEAHKGTFRFRGTNDVQRLRVDAPETYDRIIDLRGGDDSYASNGFGGGRSRYDGGAGRDHLLLATPRLAVDADLDDGRFTARKGTWKVRRAFEGFEDLVLASQEATVDGTPAGEEIVVIACDAKVSADGGRDLVHLGAMLTEDWDVPHCSSRRGVIDGGGGNDVLSGSPGRDHIVGGSGRDSADGREGRDNCQAETMTSCEVRRGARSNWSLAQRRRPTTSLAGGASQS